MPLPKRWSIVQPFSPLAPEAPQIVLAAPGSVPASQSRPHLLHWLAAGSLLAVAFRPLPRAAANSFTVLNLGNTGPGSLRAAIQSANAHPGPDVITFQPGLTGTIPLASQIIISGSIQIVGPGPGALAVSGSNITRVFYLTATSLFTATISGLTIRDGNAGGQGGGIQDGGEPLTLDHMTLISNTAVDHGGGLNFNPGPGAFTLRDSLVSGNKSGKGGGLTLYGLGGAVNIQNTQFVSNTSTGRGGGLFMYDISGPALITGTTFISNSAGNRGGGIFLYHTAALTIETSLISGNQTSNRGGGIALYKTGLTKIAHTTISDNHAAMAGGGVFLYRPSDDFSLEDSTLDNNQSATYGGGFAFYNVVSGQHAIRRTTISGNGAPAGAGLWLHKVSRPIAIENSTISDNGGLNGAGLYLDDGAAQNVSIQNSTIVSNSATAVGGGILFGPGVTGALPITDTILANSANSSDPDLNGVFVLNHDLVLVTGTATISDTGGNLFGLDPLLGPLQNNGGPTQTHLPQTGSPVLDAGDPAFAPPPSTDQRGQPRVTGPRVDMGAVEFAPGQVQFSAASYQVSENGPTAVISVTRSGGSDGVATVQFATGGGTATAGTDYVAASGTLTWTHGDAAPKTFSLTLLPDNLVESNETIGLTLSNAQGAGLGSPSSALLTLLDAGAKLFLPLVQR